MEIQAAAARFDGVREVRIDTSVVPFETVVQEDKRLVVGLPRIDQTLSDAIIEVVFDAQVLRYGAAFRAHLIDSERPFDVPQSVVAGDVIDEVFSDRVWIETSVAVQSVLEAQLLPAVLTPNGDGINDEVRIVYDLVETTVGFRSRWRYWICSGGRCGGSTAVRTGSATTSGYGTAGTARERRFLRGFTSGGFQGNWSAEERPEQGSCAFPIEARMVEGSIPGNGPIH